MNAYTCTISKRTLPLYLVTYSTLLKCHVSCLFIFLIRSFERLVSCLVCLFAPVLGTRTHLELCLLVRKYTALSTSREQALTSAELLARVAASKGKCQVELSLSFRARVRWLCQSIAWPLWGRCQTRTAWRHFTQLEVLIDFVDWVIVQEVAFGIARMDTADEKLNGIRLSRSCLYVDRQSQANMSFSHKLAQCLRRFKLAFLY